MIGSYTDVLVRSLIVAVGALVLSAPPAIALGYLFARRRFRGKSLVETFAMLPLVLPPVVSGFFLLWLFAPRSPLGSLLISWFDLRLPFTLAAAVLASAVVSFPLFLRGARVGFAGVPRELEEVAATLGHRPRQVFLRISLPLAWPGVLTGLILAFARALGEFGATLVVAGNMPGRTQTLPLAIYQATQLGDTRSGWILIGVAAVLALALMLLAARWEHR